MTIDERQRASDMVMLALCLWREARGEPTEAIQGVASCVLRRVSQPGWWGRDLLSVLFKPWQFSALTAKEDIQLTKWPVGYDDRWHKCLEVADQALDGTLPDVAPGADSYHDISIPDPWWTKGARFVKQFGRMRFYEVGLGHGGDL